jgi:GNAT superfamily N-acetyltransferase
MAPRAPSEPESWSAWASGWMLSLRQLLNNLRYRGHGGLITKRYYIWKDRQADAQREIWTDPRGYYFCNIVAVSPAAQGKGIGRKLFEIVTQRADNEDVKCYLESSKSVPNVDIYRKMGFELVKKMECKDGGDVCEVRRESYRSVKIK